MVGGKGPVLMTGSSFFSSLKGLMYVPSLLVGLFFVNIPDLKFNYRHESG